MNGTPGTRPIPFSRGGWRSEAELILRCARAALDSESAARIKLLLRKSLDWDYVLRSSTWHRLTPLLYRNLTATYPSAVPEVVLNRFQEEIRKYTLASLVSRTELLKVLKYLQEHQVPAIPLKGPALASYVYPEAWLRVPGDLDILVRRQDVLKVKDLVISLGYQPELRMTPAQEANWISSQCEYNFNLDDPLTHLEIHWRIVPPSFPVSLDHEKLWQRVKKTTFEGETILNFSPEDLLLILCIHGLKHCWERLKWVCDIAELIRAFPSLDWDKVVSRATSIGGRRTLFLGLSLAQDLLGADLPNRFSVMVGADKAVQSLAAATCQKLFREPYLRQSTFTKLKFRIRAAEHPREKLRQCFHSFRLTLTPHLADRETFPLPETLSFSYYLLRPMRLLAKYGAASARSVLGNRK